MSPGFTKIENSPRMIKSKLRLKAFFSTAMFLLASGLFLVHTGESWAQESKKRSGLQFLPEIVSMPGYEIGAGIFFPNESPIKNAVIQAILAGYGATEKIWMNLASGDEARIFTTQNGLEIPTIEFHKLNNVKYLVRVHKARRGFPLVFSENFNQEWKVYLTPSTANLPPEGEVQKLLSSYKILQGNERTQADRDELKAFLSDGLVSELGDGQIKTSKRFLPGEGHEIKTHVENYVIDFISKKFHGTIQNDNLVSKKFWETWFSGEITSQCSDESIIGAKCQVLDPVAWRVERGRYDTFKSAQWPELLHWRVNGYANGWWLDPNLIRQLLPEGGYYKLNSDESMELQLIIEYWPQRLMWLGGGVSVATFCVCMVLLIFRRNSGAVKVDAGYK